MSPPDKRKPGLGTRADATTKTYRQPEDYNAVPSPCDIPAHRLHAAEADMRFVVNTMRHERSHWWVAMIRRHRAECTWCRRCDGEQAA